MSLRIQVGPAIAALVLAFALWAFVHNAEKVPATFDVPVVYEHSDDLVRLGDHQQDVRISVRATRPKIRALRGSDFQVRVVNSSGTLGPQLEVVTPKQVDAPFGVTVDEVRPTQFTVVYDRRVTEVLPVEAELTGAPADGYELGAVEVSPSTITLAGPATLLEGVDSVRTRPVDVEGRKGRLNALTVPVVPPDPQVRIEGPSTVRVSVEIEARQEVRELEDVPVELVPGQWEASEPNPSALSVQVEGPAPLLAELDPSALRLAVDLRGVEPQPRDHFLAVDASVDPARCAGCVVVGLHPQSKINVRVKSTRRAAAAEGAAGIEAEPAATPGEDAPQVTPG